MQQSCRQCTHEFEIASDDLEFYDKVSPVYKGKKHSIPAPSLCPECRQQRRLAFRNERKLFTDQCDLCKKSVISLYSPDKPNKVYCQSCWWGDEWDPAEFKRDFDFNKPFFEQFKELQKIVPRLSIFNLQSVNSEYTNHASGNKNCYMGVALGECEDCMYSHWLLHSKDSLDMLYCEQCEQCYECLYCNNCNRTSFSEHCRSTHDSLLCYECRSCESCIGCVQLQHKKYHLFNEPVSKEEFEKYKQEMLTSHEKFAEACKKFNALKLKSPRSASLQINCQDSSGNDLYNCKNTHYSFNCRRVEDSKYIYDAADFKDSMDCYESGWGKDSELMYDVHGGNENTRNLFCNTCSNCSDLVYSELCFSGSKSLFGCISMKKKQYCILNKQYSKEEYEMMVSEIIDHMKRTGEWGGFFPPALSPFGYNESAGMEYYPMTTEEAAAKKYNWTDYEAPKPDIENAVKRSELPDNITKVSNNVLEIAITCETSQRPFRIVKKELEFYRTVGLPLPRKHPDERHKDRFALRNPRHLWNRMCEKCGVAMETSYAPERPETIYCEKCYLETVF